ncbi:hypothetical protein HPB49_010480 [Dermacentor silvarum]|uniref:Uncharacterized protein n=1 Tax=Dermacentor silvarum TaxID=543639 RepID=A0ACB8C8V1_DERSI|nr:hypothetical protein HPB49_010480 [Dermacentor silvarum]
MRLLTAVHDDCKAGKAEAAKADDGTAHQEAKGQPEGDSQTTASNLHNDHASNLHILDKSVTGKSDSLDESKEDKTAEAKHDNVDDSQHKTQCNTFTDDPDPTFLFEEVPLESIPLPEGPYIPPETQHCVSLEHEARASVSVPDIQPQSEKATKPRKRDIPPEQWLSQDAVSNDKDSISESSIKPTAKCSIETEPKSVKLDERKFTPEVKSQEVTPNSADTVQQRTVVGHSCTTAGQRKSDRFLRRQIQGNVVTQFMPGYLTFGNIIVNPAPPVYPPVRDQANSSSAELSGPPSGNCVQNVISKLEHGPTTLPASFTVEESRAVQNQSTENLVTPTEVSKCADTDSKRSHGNAQSASATTDRVVTDAELLAKRETRDDNKTRKGEPGGLPVKSRGQKDVHKHKEHTAVLSTDLKQATEGQETALLQSSKSTPRKKTQDNTSTQSEDFAAHVPKHVSVIGIATDRDSHTALSPKNEMLSHQTEPENPLPQLQEQICKEGSSTKPTENIAATQMSELQDEDNACRQAQSTKVEARLDKLATNPMEQATALLTESIAPRIIVMQDATSTLDNSNEDKTGESEVNVEQMNHGPDVSQKPNNVPVSLELTESTQSSTVQELDSAVHKCDSLSADVTPLCDLAVPPSMDSPTAANQKVQEPQEVSTKEPSPEPESFAVGELSSAPTAHKQEPEHSHHYEQQKQLDLEPKPLSELQKPEIIISTSGLAERAEREGTLPQQDSSVTMSTERISPSLKPTIVVASTSSPSPGGCTTEMKALLPETDYKNTAQELRLNHPSTETSGKTMVHVLENSNPLSDNSEAMSVNDRSPLEQSHKNTHQHGLPRKKQLQVSHEPAGKASGPTLLSAVVSHDKSEKLAANVPEHSLSSLPTESLETKPALYELPPGDNGASACEIPANQPEREPILTKYDNTISSNDNENESASCLNEEESSAQQGELEREYIEETSDLADKLMQPASDVTCDQPLTQAMVADRENLSKDPSMKDRENEETLLSFSQLQRISETIDVTNNVVQHAHHTSTDTAATIQYQFEKDIGTDEARPITAAQPSQGAQTEITSLISKNENVIIKQVISVSSHTSEQFRDGSRESAHLVCGTNQLEMTANDCKRALSVRPPSEDAGDESKILSKEHASTKRTENESLLTQEHDTFKAETAKGEEITASSDYEEMESSAEHSRDQCAQFILGEVRVGAKQGDMDNTTVLGQSDDSACNRVLEVKTDTLQEGVADIVQDLTMTPALEGVDRTSSLLSNQEAMTLSQTDLSHSTEEYRRDSGSELASKDEIKDLQGATADGEQDYMAPPASKDNEDVSAMNQKWASHRQEAADISPIEALPNNSTDEPVFVDRIANLKEGTASAEQHHSARSTSNHVEAESMLLLPTEEKTSMELTNVRSPLLEGREKAKSADAPLLEDGGEQLQESSAVTEHNILAALSTRDESENAQVLLTGQEAHLNMPITQEVNAPIGEKLCEFKMNTPAVQAFASNLRDVSRPTSLENNEVQMSLVHTADEMTKANSVNGESKTNSGDDGDQQLHEVCRAVTEYDTEPASSSMDENLLNQAKQANALPGDDQLQSHALPHEINAAVPPVPNWAQRDEESAGKPAIGLAEVDENEILVITVAEESLSEESRDKADNCQQHDHVNENIPRPTQHSIPSFKNQTTHDKVASVGIVSLPREPDIDGNANMQRNTVIQPEQPGVSPTFDASTESALFASSLEERISTSVAETAIVLSTQAGLEVIEVASVIEVSAEEIILSPDISPMHSCHLTETSQQVSAARTNEQSSQLVSTSEGRAESTAYAVGHPALASCDQGPAEFLITGSCNEELSIIPQAEQEMQDSAAEERGDVADGMSGNDIHSTEESIHVTKSPPPAVTESTRQVEAEKQLAVFIEQTEPTREDTLAGEEEFFFASFWLSCCVVPLLFEMNSGPDKPFAALKEVAARLDVEIPNAANCLEGPRTTAACTSARKVSEMATVLEAELKLVELRLEKVVKEKLASIQELTECLKQTDCDNKETLQKLIPLGFKVPDHLLPALQNLSLQCDQVTAKEAADDTLEDSACSLRKPSQVPSNLSRSSLRIWNSKHASRSPPRRFHGSSNLDRYLEEIGNEDTVTVMNYKPQASRTAAKPAVASGTPDRESAAPVQKVNTVVH